MPVHTALVPDVSVFATKGLENINPAMNGNGNGGRTRERERERENVNPLAGKAGALGGFDGFADLNPFTMKTLDAYVFFLFSFLSRLFGPFIFFLGRNCNSNAHPFLFPFFFFDFFCSFFVRSLGTPFGDSYAFLFFFFFASVTHFQSRYNLIALLPNESLLL